MTDTLFYNTIKKHILQIYYVQVLSVVSLCFERYNKPHLLPILQQPDQIQLRESTEFTLVKTLGNKKKLYFLDKAV